MAVPKKKVSKTRKHRRHAKWAFMKLRKIKNYLAIVKCENCNQDKIAHRICPHCGYYKWKQVISIKTKSKEEILEA